MISFLVWQVKTGYLSLKDGQRDGELVRVQMSKESLSLQREETFLVSPVEIDEVSPLDWLSSLVAYNSFLLDIFIFDDHLSQNFHRFVTLCWDTQSENAGLWYLPKVSSVLNLTCYIMLPSSYWLISAGFNLPPGSFWSSYFKHVLSQMYFSDALMVAITTSIIGKYSNTIK